MIYQFSIFDRGGTVLWSDKFEKVSGSPIDVLVRSVLVEDRAGLSNFSHRDYVMEWKLANEHGIVLVVLYSKHFQAKYAGTLLERVRTEFLKNYGADIKAGKADQFREIWRYEENNAASRPAVATAPSKPVVEVRQKKSRSAPREEPTIAEEDEGVTGEETSAVTEDAPQDEHEAGETAQPLTQEQIRKKLLAKRGKKKPDKQAAEAPPTTTTETVSRSKPARTGAKMSKEEEAALDFSVAQDEAVESEEQLNRVREQFLEAPASKYNLIPDEENGPGNTEAADKLVEDSKVMSFFKGLAGRKELTAQDLRPALEKLEEQLVGKNVAGDIAAQLCSSVGISLEGKVPGSFKSVSGMVRNAMIDALTRLLTPKQSVDILGQAKFVKEREKRPFVIAFCGVNGVGKSTSLAKTCFYLQRQGLEVHLAACDTFRSGAVEQLRTHARCLNAPLYDQGYGKDPAAVAKHAITTAAKSGADVVLIDTAGRMQNDEPLMRSLSKLVTVNQPDRIFFVGEALVGNDAVDQLVKFNGAISKFAPPEAKHRGVDGIVLTKFDTIDDKVGAAVSMVYSTGQPIVFVGVGQTYMDLRKVNTKALVNALLR